MNFARLDVGFDELRRRVRRRFGFGQNERDRHAAKMHFAVG
jgi:hypothetical protein